MILRIPLHLQLDTVNSICVFICKSISRHVISLILSIIRKFEIDPRLSYKINYTNKRYIFQILWNSTM